MKETDFCPTCRYYLYLNQTKSDDEKEDVLRRMCRNCGYQEQDNKGGLVLEIDLREKTSEGYKILMNELQQHNPELIDKRRVIAITKCDMIDDELQSQIMNEIPADKMNDGMKVPVLFISAATNKGIIELKDVLWSLMNERSFLDRE